MKNSWIVFVVILSMLWTTAALAQLKEGLWEITTQVEIKGMPQSMPPATVRQCITQNDAVHQKKDKNYDCKITDQKLSGNPVSYTVECKGKEGVMKTTGKTTYSGNSMNGASTTHFKMKGQPEMQMANKIKGKYIGSCSK
jgi:hypothetical protein